MGDVKLIVLNNGLQLIGEIISVEHGDVATHSLGKLVVANPVTVHIVPTKDQTTPGQTKNQIGFGAFLDYSEEFAAGIPFSISDVLTVVTPRAELIEHYRSLFSNIILPNGPTGLRSV